MFIADDGQMRDGDKIAIKTGSRLTLNFICGRPRDVRLNNPIEDAFPTAKISRHKMVEKGKRALRANFPPITSLSPFIASLKFNSSCFEEPKEKKKSSLEKRQNVKKKTKQKEKNKTNKIKKSKKSSSANEREPC